MNSTTIQVFQLRANLCFRQLVTRQPYSFLKLAKCSPEWKNFLAGGQNDTDGDSG